MDIAFEPAGTKGFDDLARGAVRFEVSGATLDVASLAAILRSNETANGLWRLCGSGPTMVVAVGPRWCAPPVRVVSA
jgi:hypothetical protein